MRTLDDVTTRLACILALACPAGASASGCAVDRPETHGLRLRGAASGARLGERNGLAGGDLDGDVRPDFVVAAPFESLPSRALAGVVRAWFAPVPFGLVDLASSAADADPLNDTDVEVIGRAGWRLGSSVAAGDVSGDGADDLILGALGHPAGPGAVVVVFGPFCTGDIIDLEARPPDVVLGGPGIRGLGHVVEAADLTGDGSLDIAAGAPAASGPSGTRPEGGAVVVFPGPFGSGDMVDPLAAGARAFVVHGAMTGDAEGWDVASGDVNGDGLDDLVVGARAADTPSGVADAGRVDIASGPLPAAEALDLAVAPADLTLFGDRTAAQLGFAVHVAELSGDCAADLVTSAMPLPQDGEVHVFFGPLGGGSMDLATVRADCVARGEAPDQFYGFALDSGDLNGDGQDDLVAGAVGWELVPGSRRRTGAVTGVMGPLIPGFDGRWSDASRGTAGGAVAFAYGSFGDGHRKGSSVLAADVLGDSRADVVGGAPSAPGVAAGTASAGSVGADFLPPAGAADAGACRPRTHGFWHRQCLSLAAPEGLDRGRRADVPREQALTAHEMRQILAAASRRLCGLGDDISACDALAPEPMGDPRTRAQRAVTALLLNRAAGFLGPDAALAPPGFPEMSGAEGEQLALSLLASRDWLAAEHLALRINSGAACARGGPRRGR